MNYKVLHSQGEFGGSNGKRPIELKTMTEPKQGMKQLKMLHVEDEEIVANVVLRTAQRVVDTSKIRQVDSAEKALEILKTNEDFDLILLDLRMPGMGGIGMIRQLMSEGRTDLIDKIFVASGTLGDLRDEPKNKDVVAAIGDRLLAKPVESGVLMALFKFVADGWEANLWTPPKAEPEESGA